MDLAIAPTGTLADSFGRVVRYVRISVTDRCDLRCVYCMSETMTFAPRKELLTLEELQRLCDALVANGVRKIRLTGGEPLHRPITLDLIRSLSRHLASGALDEVTLTTNGTRLAHTAQALADAGVRRVNVSVDSLDPAAYAAITRGGRLSEVLNGIDAARAAGLHVKINTVALKDLNQDEIPGIMTWAHGRSMDMSLIEVMPLGDTGVSRNDQFVSLGAVKQALDGDFGLTPLAMKTGGPARYYRVERTGGRLGFITPLSHNFCDSCNRVRITCTGQLFTCLGHEGAVDLRGVLRTAGEDALLAAIRDGLWRKPRGHDFETAYAADRQGVSRHMSVTGG
jgi:cyclic pyranopterin phosphate synthase